MNTMDRIKEYFGMSPVAAYEDEYLDDYERPAHHELSGRDRREDYRYEQSYDETARDHRPRRTPRAELDPESYHEDHRAEAVRRPRVADDEPVRRAHRYTTAESLDPAPRAGGAVRGSVALAPEHDRFDDGLVTSPETVVERPRGFGDGKALGEHFRAGKAVVLDLSGMAREDARRMVDFAAGLVFGLDGGMQKVAERERTFLLQPAGMDLTEAEVREAVHEAFRR